MWGVATQDRRLRPRDPTHLAGDALLLCDKDVLLPQSLLQPLGSQHGLASLQSRCNRERAGGDAAGDMPGLPTAPLLSGHCLAPAPVKSMGQSLGSAHTRSELNHYGQKTPSKSDPELCFQHELLPHAPIYQDLPGGNTGPLILCSCPCPAPWSLPPPAIPTTAESFWPFSPT